jgi:hypothetical protein
VAAVIDHERLEYFEKKASNLETLPTVGLVIEPWANFESQ